MNIVIYSNCQGKVLIELLNEKLKGHYQHIHNYKYFENPKLLPISTLNSADIFIFTFTKKNNGICCTDPNNEENIFSFLKKECIKIGIPSIFQSSFWPVIPGFGSCRDGHEIIKDLKNIYSLNEILKLYDNNKLNFKLYDRFDKCEKHTKLIEEYYQNNTNLITIPITNFIRNNYKKYNLFLTHCHPSIYIFLYITNEIIKIINKQIYNSDTITYFENIFSYDYDYKIKHMIGGNDWCNSKYIIKELDIKYFSNVNDNIIKNNISLIYHSL